MTERRAHFWIMIFWALNIPAVCAVYLLVGRDAFTVIMLLYLAVVSIYANFSNHWVGWLAARMREEQKQSVVS